MINETGRLINLGLIGASYSSTGWKGIRATHTVVMQNQANAEKSSHTVVMNKAFISEQIVMLQNRANAEISEHIVMLQNRANALIQISSLINHTGSELTDYLKITNIHGASEHHIVNQAINKDPFYLQLLVGMGLMDVRGILFGLGTNGSLLIPEGFGPQSNHSLLLNYGTWAEGVLAQKNVLSGCSLPTVECGGRLAINQNPFGITSFHNLNRPLFSNSAIASIINLITETNLSSLNKISNMISSDPLVAQQIIDQPTSSSSGELTISSPIGFNQLINILKSSVSSDGLARIIGLLGTVTAESIASILSVKLEIQERAIITGLVSYKTEISELSLLTEIVPWDLYLDGGSIKNEVKNVKVSFRQEIVHNTIDIGGLSTSLFNQSSPQIRQGESRLELHVGGRVLFFLLEKRTGTEESFNLWGRSLTAQIDSPFAEEVGFALSATDMASSIAADIADTRTLDWECVDWAVPVTFEYNGNGVDGLLALASEVGGVLRAQDDGSFTIRPETPIKPVDIADQVPTLEYDRASNIIGLSYEEAKGSGANKADIDGYSMDEIIPSLVLEDTGLIRTEDFYIRAYWNNVDPVNIITDAYVSDGNFELLGDFTEEADYGSDGESELVTFEFGSATLRFPIESIIGVEWIGDGSGTVSFDRYSQEVTLPTDDTWVARIRYNTTFRRYRAFNHDVEALAFTLFLDSASGRGVAIIVGADPSEVDYGTISAPLLTNDAALSERAQTEIFKERYYRKLVRFRAPYRDDAVDGGLAYIDSDQLNIVGNCQILAADINLEGPKVTNTIEVIQWVL